MNLKYLTREAYNSLKKDIDLNKEKYYSDEKWLQNYFKENEITEPYRESSIIVKDIELDYSGNDIESKNKDDLNNVIKIYDAYKDKITPAVASDPLLWTALCHLEYKDYILKRWKKDNGDVRLEQRFFAGSSRDSLTYYNAISRLWWSGYLTYDEGATDPWALTKTLLSAQQIQKDLFDQPFSMNRDIVKGLLKALARIQKEKHNACTPTFRLCCDSYLNHYGAVTSIDSLTSEEVETIAYEYMKKILTKEIPGKIKSQLNDKKPATKKKGSKKKKK